MIVLREMPYSVGMSLIEHRWGSFANGEEGYEELDTPIAYRIGMKTWANWVDSNVDPNTTRVFFTTMSPTHTRSSLSLPAIILCLSSFDITIWYHLIEVMLYIKLTISFNLFSAYKVLYKMTLAYEPTPHSICQNIL